MISAPPIPSVPEETGIELELLQKLVGKTLYMHGTMTPSAIGREMRLATSVIILLLKDLQKLQFIEAKGLAGADMRSEVRFALGGKGHEWVAEAMAQSQYVGPAPVSLTTFVEQIRHQSITQERVTRDMLQKSLAHLVLPDDLVDLLGPAVNSARSVLLYGDPGNGKTSIAEAVGGAFQDTIYIPHCFEVAGQIINFFDPTIHTPVESSDNSAAGTGAGAKPAYDMRWQACRRPFVLTGGELTLDMLDLAFNPISRFYEAPVHFKATGGIFVVDDFGRQRTDPQSVLNRWIIPLERQHDQLTLHTGKKFSVPFDQLAIFSTNLEPEKLADAGALRRLYYKIKVPTPTANDYKAIFEDVVAQQDMEFDQAIFTKFFEKHYRNEGAICAGHHPKYIVDFIMSVCNFRDERPHMDEILMEGGWNNLNVR